MKEINYSIVTSVYNDGIYAKKFCNEIISLMSEYIAISEEEIHNYLEIIIVNDLGPVFNVIINYYKYNS